MKVKELRIILTVDNLDEIIQFYRDVAGFQVSKEWRDEATGNGIILEAGKADAVLHADRIDDAQRGHLAMPDEAIEAALMTADERFRQGIAPTDMAIAGRSGAFIASPAQRQYGRII